jgi:oligoribonuclease (3'-5' exoribonuclease)
MLAWIDLETTGLVSTEHAVLEVAAIVTDDRLRGLCTEMRSRTFVCTKIATVCTIISR